MAAKRRKRPAPKLERCSTCREMREAKTRDWDTDEPTCARCSDLWLGVASHHEDLAELLVVARIRLEGLANLEGLVAKIERRATRDPGAIPALLAKLDPERSLSAAS